MIRLTDINKRFNETTPNEVHLIKDLNLQVKKGDFITIIGSNGAGKTTLFNLISGNLLPSSGSIFIDQREVTNAPEYKRAKYLGRIFQDPLLGTASSMTLEDNMMITYKKGFKWLNISLDRRMRDFFKTELIQLDMGLENRMRENVCMLSGGQRQALTLLMTVLSNPKILLLDEHTAALDPRNAAIVMDLTRQFIQTHSLTTLMITHNMKHAIEYGNRLLMMDSGEIIIDIDGDEKKNLTPGKLVERFSEIRQKEFENDEVLLTR
jgi:putative ABC transport system ATP-binding protein